jgi:hypothetical protein
MVEINSSVEQLSSEQLAWMPIGDELRSQLMREYTRWAKRKSRSAYPGDTIENVLVAGSATELARAAAGIELARNRLGNGTREDRNGQSNGPVLRVFDSKSSLLPRSSALVFVKPASIDGAAFETYRSNTLELANNILTTMGLNTIPEIPQAK